MDFSAVCRTCLSKSCLNPIFLNPDDHRHYSSAVFIATGVKIEYNDGLPQNMCLNCINYLNNSLKFRKQCRDVEKKLLNVKNNSKNAPIDLKPNFSCNKLEEPINNENTVKRKKSTLETGIKVEASKEPQVKCEEQSEIKTEFSDFEIFEDDVDDGNDDEDDDDDKPLKYLTEPHDKDDVNCFFDYIETMKSALGTATKPGATANQQRIDSSDPKRRRVTCKLCQKNLSVRSIDSHMARSHPGADDRKVKCELCDTYVLKQKLNRHKKLIHGSEKALRCGYCKSEFDSKEVLVDHVAMCTAKKKKRKVSESGRQLRECEICHKMMQKASLRMHKAVKHAGLGPVCEHCGRRFGNKFRLDEHYRAKHGYEKFRCSYCDFQSAGVMAMRNHERRHRGEKPFVCETCGAKFHAAYLLAQHKQSHRTEKLVKCDLCPASFKANNSLHMHKITCHSNFLFKCTMCSRAYSCRHYAVKHLRHVHDYKGPVPPLQRVDNHISTITTDVS